MAREKMLRGDAGRPQERLGREEALRVDVRGNASVAPMEHGVRCIAWGGPAHLVVRSEDSRGLPADGTRKIRSVMTTVGEGRARGPAAPAGAPGREPPGRFARTSQPPRVSCLCLGGAETRDAVWAGRRFTGRQGPDLSP